MEISKKGRPRKYDYSYINEYLQKYTEKIFIHEDDGTTRLAAKGSDLWVKLSEGLQVMGMTAPNLYCYVANDRGGFRSKAIIQNGTETVENMDVDGKEYKQTNLEEEEESEGEEDPTEQSISFSVPSDVFEGLLVRTIGSRGDSRSGTREQWSLVPYNWQPIIHKYLRLVKPDIPCSFRFKTYKLHSRNLTGTFYGKCNCGTQIDGYIHNFLAEGNVIITCKLILVKNPGKCGIDYLRGKERSQLGREMAEKDFLPSIVCAEEALKVQRNEKPVQTLYRPYVLKQAKTEFRQSLRVDPCPFRSLEKLELGELKNVIHFLSSKPFCVHYWTHHQLDVYRAYCLQRSAFISIDATGSIVEKFMKADRKTPTQAIFLYQAVINFDGRQFPVSQMMTEAHYANNILHWLSEWFRLGAPIPRKVVCDGSLALLNAIVQSCTEFRTLTQYMNSLFQGTKASCEICLDVAHFMHKYSVFLGKNMGKKKRFLMCCIGLLVQASSKSEAGNILQNILCMLTSETVGRISSRQKTTAEEAIETLNRLLVQTDLDYDYEETDAPETSQQHQKSNQSSPDLCSVFETEADSSENLWQQWGEEIRFRVEEKILGEDGDRDNPYYLQGLAKYLMKDVRYISLWGCICHEDHKTASSSSVESYFNTIKNRLLKNVSTPMRVDDFIIKHSSYITGKLALDNIQKRAEEPQGTNQQLGSKIPEPFEIQAAPEGSNEKSMSRLVDPVPNPSTPSCPICAGGNVPGGAHTCVVCMKAVHPFPPCSLAIPGEEEGYGERRVCASCNEQTPHSAPHIIGANSQENWRGLAKTPKRTKKSGYLQSKYNPTTFSELKRKEIPVIKNANCIDLRAVNVEGKNITLANTCAFDSLAQILLVAYFDHPTVTAHVDQHENIALFKMLLTIAKSNINVSTYRDRCKMLMAVFPERMRNTIGNNWELSSECTPLLLLGNVLKTVPAFHELTRCDKCEHETRREMYSVTAGRDVISHNLSASVEASLEVEGHRSCRLQGCYGNVSTRVETGPLLFIETIDQLEHGDVTQFTMKNIPFELQVQGENFQLVGVIEIKGGMRRESRNDDLTRNIAGVSHYIPLIRRRDGTFIKCDDLSTPARSDKLKPNYKFVPEMLIYTKEE